MRLPRRLLLLPLLACAVATGPLAAQQAVELPARPKLVAGADTNDWQAYYRLGMTQIGKRPDRAATALYWAAQLAPHRAEAQYARWGSSWLTRKMLLVEHFRTSVGDSYVEQVASTPESRAIDSLYERAMLRNPFVHQVFERALQGAVLDRKFGAGKWGWEANEENEAWIAYTEGRFRKAADLFAFVAHTDGRGKHPEYRLWRARSLVLLQQYDSAAATLDTMIARARERGDDAKRAAQSGQAPPEDVSGAMLEYTLGLVHLMRNDRASAKSAFGRAIERQLSFYMAHAAIGGVKLAEGDTAGAVSAFEDAIAINGNDPVLRADLGTILLSSGRFAEAAQHLQRAVLVAPWYAAPYYNLAVALERQKRGAEAGARYREFIARAPRTLAAQVQVAREHAALLESQGSGGGGGD